MHTELMRITGSPVQACTITAGAQVLLQHEAFAANTFSQSCRYIYLQSDGKVKYTP